jgi:N-acetylglucosaminyldiphosphoundecaprenol N-acetyl-beta-D-mannosaminyltransferase
MSGTDSWLVPTDGAGYTSHLRVLGLRLNPLNMIDTVAVIEDRIDAGTFTQHVVVNTAKLVYAQSDEELRAALDECHIVNVDGMGVVWGARLLGFNIPERVAGIDLFHHLLQLGERRGFPVFLLGAREDVVNQTRECLAGQYPKLCIAGHHHGYFWKNEEAVVKLIRESGARLLFVAVTSPDKERFINRWKDQLGVDFVMGVGGTFDVVAGRVKRAPVWMQSAGLEWFHRILQEPRRMWKRYAVTNTMFAWMILRGLLSKQFRINGYVARP